MAAAAAAAAASDEFDAAELVVVEREKVVAGRGREIGAALETVEEGGRRPANREEEVVSFFSFSLTTGVTGMAGLAPGSGCGSPTAAAARAATVEVVDEVTTGVCQGEEGRVLCGFSVDDSGGGCVGAANMDETTGEAADLD